jgi:hypothetical protein
LPFVPLCGHFLFVLCSPPFFSIEGADSHFTLQVGGQAQTVEVSVAADTLMATTSASLGTVLPEYKIRDRPLAGRDVIDLVQTTAGVGDSNFAGAPTGFTMTTRDGIPVNQGRYNARAQEERLRSETERLRKKGNK